MVELFIILAVVTAIVFFMNLMTILLVLRDGILTKDSIDKTVINDFEGLMMLNFLSLLVYVFILGACAYNYIA